MQRVGPALLGGEWIGALSAKERWLLEEGSKPPARPRSLTSLSVPASSVLPGVSDYFPQRSSRVSDADLAAAQQRQEFRRWQRAKVIEWLDARGLGRNPDGQVNQDDFERAFATTFPNAPWSIPSSADLSAADSTGGALDRDKALAVELARRITTGEDRQRDAMVSWMSGEFPGLSREAREALYYAAPKNLRSAKRGRPAGGWRS